VGIQETSTPEFDGLKLLIQDSLDHFFNIGLSIETKVDFSISPYETMPHHQSSDQMQAFLLHNSIDTRKQMEKQERFLQPQKNNLATTAAQFFRCVGDIGHTSMIKR
jgi:hypothetical protein